MPGNGSEKGGAIVSASLPLLNRYPALARAHPGKSLGRWPTPVERVAASGLPAFHVKRDDRCSALYAGNKIRKLEFLFGQALAEGRRRLFVVGYAGSNFTLATALHARRAGLETTALLLPQAREDYVRRNLLWSASAGARLELCSGELTLAARALRLAVQARRLEGRWPMWVPPGGSSPAAVLGFVNAALELDGQIRAGELPCPRRVYIAVGSMGSAVGLAVGFALLDRAIEVVAVPVTPPRYASPQAARELACRVARLVDGDDRRGQAAMRRLRWRDGFSGPAYGVPNEDSAAAAAWLAEQGMRADQSYAAKAFSCLLGDLRAGGTDDDEALFWLTSNSCQPPELPADDCLPPRIRAWLAE